MKKSAFLLLLPLLFGGCATLSAEDLAVRRAECERMENGMGLGQTHDHSQLQGRGPSGMNLSHSECVRLLRTK